MLVKISTNADVPITVLNVLDIDSLVYENQIKGNGYCEFTCRNDNEKLNAESLKMFNKLRIFEGTKCVFYGEISENIYNLNTLKVRAVSLSSKFKHRLNSTSVMTGTVDTLITDMIDDMNAYSPTGITIGDIALTNTVNKTYGEDTIEYVLNDLIGNAQMYVDTDGRLWVDNLIGTDLSDSVVFKYDIRQVQASNLLSFSVKEDTSDIATEVYAKDGGGVVSIVTSPTLVAKYGVVQMLKTYSTVSGGPALIVEGTKDLSDRTFSPELTLAPNVKDDFNVGDLVSVQIYNKFIDIKTTYQVLVKTVSYIGNQKQIQIRVNDKVKSVLDVLKTQNDRLRQLEK